MASSTAATVAGSSASPNPPCNTSNAPLLTTTPPAPTSENRPSRRKLGVTVQRCPRRRRLTSRHGRSAAATFVLPHSAYLERHPRRGDSPPHRGIARGDEYQDLDRRRPRHGP